MTYAPIQGKCPACHQDSANTSFQAGAASRDAEIAELQRKLANEQARDIHSCHSNCTREGCVNRRLRAELEAAKAEIERLKTVPMKYRRMAFNAHLQDENAKLSKQLAAEQAKNVGLRELVEHFALIDLGRSLLPDDFGLWVLRARKAIATPSDTSELEAIVKKAGEVMRERIEQWQISQGWKCREDMEPESIHALPGVTLEDLK